MHSIATVCSDLFDLTSSDDALLAVIAEVYGDQPDLCRERAAAWRHAVNGFIDRFGARDELLLIRAPARANLLGKHADSQGGHANCICLPTELIMVAAPRTDDRLVLCDARREQFPDSQLALGDLITPADARKPWTDYLIGSADGAGKANWINYVAGPFVYLQHRFEGRRIRGIDALLSGNIVSAAGLSSSSALSVAGMLATVAVNGIDEPWSRLALWAGEAEWFSGTRGGAGDHTAILLTPPGKLAHMRTHPDVHVQPCEFPDTCEVVAIYSGRPAIKSRIANRNIFNAHAACYRFGIELLRPHFDEGHAVELIADLIDPRRGLSERDVLEAIATLPERATRAQLKRAFVHDPYAFEQIISSHDEPQVGYPIRRVCLFGVGEFSRSRLAPELLERGDVAELGRLMSLSHEGDRVVRPVTNGRLQPHDNEASDADMGQLIARAATRAGEYPLLPEVPGGYANSCADLDRIVDIALTVEGVYGAALTGAGLGGHVLALVEPGGIEPLTAALRRDYFDRYDVPCCIYPCPPMSGASMHRLT